MKHKKTITGTIFLLFGLGVMQAQEAITATGGESMGTGGTASYSVGQIVYRTITSVTGSASQGVQQPFEIQVVTGINEKFINLIMNVYPNPSTNYLTLNVEEKESSLFNYQLYDLQGKLLKSNQLTSNNTLINVEKLPKATYFLRVNKNNKEVKTFKIIKN